MQNNDSADEGKRLTLYNLMSRENWDIEIPIIQRDYAQGRAAAYEVRNTFIATLLEHLQSGENIDLDFIYGSIKENDDAIFIPLDGQQRLTTLFLLHWYLAHKEGFRNEFLKIFAKEGRSRFSYETRISSKEFCDSLIAKGIDFDNLVNDCISDTIKDSAWFYISWQDDPTIQSMLTMLDEIHEQFKDEELFFEKLLHTANPVITFQFLNLDTFKLTDDLYIKMNARGKQLTPFENFKAKFEQHIKQQKFEKAAPYSIDFGNASKAVPVHEYFSFKIDTEWANLFWKYKNETTKVFDDQIMNFFRVMAMNFVASSKDNSVSSLRLLNSRAVLSFQIYRKNIGCLVPDFILELIDVLDYLKNGNERIKKYLPDNAYIDEAELFEKVIANNLSYTERIQFYAVYQYLLKNGNTDGLNEWVRVIYNLTENTIFNELDEYVIAIGSVKRLLKHSSNILEYLSSSKERIAGFIELQVQEERIKACLMLRDKIWYDKVVELEGHGYFKGQISFLLNFAGIESYYVQYKNCDWDIQQNQIFLDSVIQYNQKAVSVFDANGLRNFPEFLFERALLSKGDYTLTSKSNHSFLVNTGRDISWKRLLRDNNEGKRAYIKNLLDDAAFDTSSVSNSLKEIIDLSQVADWRRDFIELPGIMQYLGTQMYFRYNGSSDIKLLQKERLSGTHAEYYSYGLFLRHIKNSKNVFAPFGGANYVDVSGDYLSYIRLRYPGKQLNLDISWIAYRSAFRIELLHSSQIAISFPHTDLLIENGFVEVSPFAFEKYVLTTNEAYNAIVSICQHMTEPV